MRKGKNVRDKVIRTLAPRRAIKKVTYVALPVHVVVRELDFLEGDDLLAKLLAGER